MQKIATELTLHGDHLCGRFSAMASPCEILFDCCNADTVKPYFLKAVEDTKRIEAKYSRYLKDNVLYRINQSAGKPVKIDNETYQLLCFAHSCFELSAGKFDLTSGILRKAWSFDGSANVPAHDKVQALLPYIGWQQVEYSQSHIQLPPGFELDLGGIGKEYAVNKVAQDLAQMLPSLSILVNFGGDIQVTQARQNSPFWQIGIENPSQQKGVAVVNIAKGGLATSGDANRYLLKNNKRYSHILDPFTGYPIEHAPRSVTVAADYCVQAGIIATLALLQGNNAETFLAQQGLKHWCYR